MRFVVVFVFVLVCMQSLAWGVTSYRLSEANREIAKLKERIPPEEKTDDGKLYGHPKPPVKAVYDSLPAPVEGYAWEVFTQAIELAVTLEDPRGHFTEQPPRPGIELVVRMIDLAHPDTPTPPAKTQNLIYERYSQYGESSSTSWSESYAQRSKADRIERMNQRFIKPFYEWATTKNDEVRALSISPDGPGEYMMKGA